MAKKKREEKPRREPTKRQLSRWQQQQKRQRIILSAGIFVIVAVLMLIVVGWYTGQYRPLHQTVIRVNNTEFNMKYYIEMLKLRGSGQPAQYMEYLTDVIVEDITQNELIKQGALKLGVSVSDDEVKEELKSSDLPVNDVYRDLVRTQLLIDKLRDEYFERQVPAFTEQRHIMAMLLESERQVLEVRARLENSENFTDLAEELSLNYFSKDKKGDLDWHPKSILSELLGTSIPGEYAFGSEVGVLSQPLYNEEITKIGGYWLIRVLDREEEDEEAHVQTMLLGSEEEAQDVRARLEAGESFATLARELSQLNGVKENEGDLGTVSRGEMPPAFDEFAFNTQVKLGTLSEPIRDETVETKGGHWLIQVLEKDDNRQIEKNDRDFLKAKALDEWVASLRDDPGNEIDDSFLDNEKKAWALQQAMKS